MANKEYIERNALLKDIDSSIVFTVRSDLKHPPEIQGAKKVIERIKVAPVADVVKVVRCKDCIHYEIGKDYQPCCNDILMEMKPNDFCSYGVRK